MNGNRYQDSEHRGCEEQRQLSLLQSLDVCHVDSETIVGGCSYEGERKKDGKKKKLKGVIHVMDLPQLDIGLQRPGKRNQNSMSVEGLQIPANQKSSMALAQGRTGSNSPAMARPIFRKKKKEKFLNENNLVTIDAHSKPRSVKISHLCHGNM